LSADLDLLSDSCGESRWLESARTQITRLNRLIKNLVELARTEEAIEGDTIEEFSVTEIAQASVDAFQPAAEADGKTLVSEIETDINTKGVRDNFFYLFSILLDNAVKYCDPEGTIRLSLSQHGRNICISVSNPCKGIDTAQLSRYFDRFYRVDSSRSRSTGGYGIGLSTAKAIVIRHHGHIANSYADGVITFTAKIPKTC
jgi:signal transduction histidine kinase